MSALFPPKHPILGAPISITTFDEVQRVIDNPRTDRATVIAVCNVHSVMTARRNPELAEVLREADVATPDGMPLVWGLRALGHEQGERVYGPAIMERAVANQATAHEHFLFGSTPETLDRLQERIRRLNPEARIAGAVSPPFRPLTPSEDDEILRAMTASGASVVWVGLGMPKQELWMDGVKTRLPGVTLVGVGAAFDFLAGAKPQAPPWMQERGLEWLYRFVQEPGRMWKRYAWNNPAYLGLLGVQVVRERGMRRSRIQEPRP